LHSRSRRNKRIETIIILIKKNTSSTL